MSTLLQPDGAAVNGHTLHTHGSSSASDEAQPLGLKSNSTDASGGSAAGGVCQHLP